MYSRQGNGLYRAAIMRRWKILGTREQFRMMGGGHFKDGQAGENLRREHGSQVTHKVISTLFCRQYVSGSFSADSDMKRFEI